MVRLLSSTFLALAVLATSAFTRGQDQSREVDKIFAGYNQTGSPGCSLGVIHEGRFLYRKSYGEASLELGVPFSPESVFYVGSVSKQFTAASVVLAAEHGFVSLDDDVRKYIPELPDYGHAITLRQMLNQTSGLRDFFDLIYFSGHDAADFNSPSEILKLIERQKGLNNVPGAEWVYSNTNYFLLGIVLQRATGKTLAQYARENIFRPLGMTHTSFYDDASVVVPGRVAAYDSGPTGQFLVDWSTTYAIVGGGGLMTTIPDLLQWDNNFYTNKLGTGELTKELETPGTLNDGNKIAYGMGLIPGNYRGLPTIEHNGSAFGYRDDIIRFPEQKFTVICLCNISNANPEERSREIADIYLKSKMQPDSISIAAVDKELPDPAPFAGQYLDPNTHTIYSFASSDGHLRAWGSDLRRKNANHFYDLFGDVFTFEGSKDTMKVSLDIDGETYFEGTRFKEIHLNGPALQPFTGDYKSSQLDGAIQLRVEDGNLILKNGSNSPVTLIPISKDEFEAEGSFVFDFHRDELERVSGLSWSEHAARGIEFVRTN
jgi:CubicO group peptidase (beta-lactamase class C family)